MIKEVKGDLVEAFKRGDVNVIAHCCNCFHTMGAGVAKAIAKAFPEALEADKLSKRGDKDKLGSCSLAITECGLVVNLYGQYRYGRDRQHLDYTALKNSLLDMISYLDIERDNVKLGVPRLGCYNAGGDYEIVKTILEEVFKGWDVTVYSL